jgi:creatinine amidohydrolase
MTRLLTELPGPLLHEQVSQNAVVVVPIGAVEHHGPHLPLATDAIIAEAVAVAAIERAADAGLEVWRMPTISYAKSDEHAWAAGTVWLDPQTLRRTLMSVGRAVASTQARRIFFVNGHGGNTALLHQVIRELRRELGLLAFAAATGVQHAGTGDGEPDELGFGIHAGHSETSVMLELRPDLVHLDRAGRAIPEWLTGYHRIGFAGTPVSFGWLSSDFGTNGVIGDPTGATAGHGRQYLRTAIDGTVESLAEIARFTFPPGG